LDFRRICGRTTAEETFVGYVSTRDDPMDLLARTRITCGRVSNGVHQSISALCSNGVALILWARDNARQPTGRAILAHYQYQRMTRLRERLLVGGEKLLQAQGPTIPRNLCISCRQKKNTSYLFLVASPAVGTWNCRRPWWYQQPPTGSPCHILETERAWHVKIKSYIRIPRTQR
jgi:hypothetical protein